MPAVANKNLRNESTGEHGAEPSAENWNATLEQKVVMAALEWESIFAEQSEVFDHRGVDRDVYLQFIRKDLSGQGRGLRDFIENSLIYVTDDYEILTLQLFGPTIGGVQIEDGYTKNTYSPYFERAAHQLIEQGQIREFQLGDGRFYFCRPVTLGAEASVEALKEWHLGIVQHIQRVLSVPLPL